MSTLSHVCRTMLLVGGVLLATSLRAEASSRSAQARAEPEPQAVSDSQLAQAITVLQATKLTLEDANHDYGGHRAAAVKAVKAAEKQLKLALKFEKKKAGGTTEKLPKTGDKAEKGGNTEPQKVSDSQLVLAIGVLKTTRTTLEAADHDYGGHRAKAVKDIGHAVKQLEQALKFEKKQEEKKAKK